LNDKTNIPLVSIAMATFNGEEYLIQQLDTLVAQSYQNLEIVVSDDGSTDNTLSILELYAKKYSNFFVHKNEVLHGVKRNFENALEHCKGTYIAFSDQDDLWMLDKIEKQVNAIGDYAAIYHNSLFIDKNGNSLHKSLGQSVNSYSGFDARSFLLFNCVSGHALLFHRKMLEIAIPFPDARYHDWWLAFRAADNGGIKYLNETLVHYRQHNKSQTDFLLLKNRERDNRKIEEEEDIKWFTVCASVNGKHQGLFKKWLGIYKDKKKHVWNIKIFLLLLVNMRAIFYISKKSILSKFINLIKRSWGKNIIIR
jgi:glycosyltransferase involved in cell wall biosynthesis